MKKVLIALDYNSDSQRIANNGWSMAQAINADIVLLHVLSDSKNYSSMRKFKITAFKIDQNTEPIQPDSPDDLRNNIQNFLDETKKHLEDNTILTLIKEGDIAESIVNVAKELAVDIIVLGSRNRKRLKNTDKGSVLANILHLTSVPLFIIPSVNDKERYVESDKKATLTIL